MNTVFNILFKLFIQSLSILHIEKNVLKAFYNYLKELLYNIKNNLFKITLILI